MALIAGAVWLTLAVDDGGFGGARRAPRFTAARAAPPSGDVLPAPPPAISGTPRERVTLPRSVGVWTRTDTAAVYDAETLFDYMNGGAEIYLGYRYDRTDVYEYLTSDEDLDDIVVELYWMDSSDDAYGLLSRDWRGTPTDLGDGAPADHALYGGGLLRIWSDDLFARVLAYSESPSSKAAVLEIGRAIVAGRPVTEPPAFVSTAPESIGPDLRLLPDRICFLRSHHVLNAVRFVSTANILELDESTEGLAAAYGREDGDGDARPVWLVLVRYASAERAARALASFVAGYPGSAAPAANPGADRGVIQSDRGWVGFGRAGRELAVTLDCPSEDDARRIIEQVTAGR